METLATMQTKRLRVCVIGAGISGLVTSRIFLAAGHEVSIFESGSELGGVWASYRRYPGLRTQSPRLQYELPGLSMSEAYDEFPSGKQMQAYLTEYAKQSGIENKIRFNRAVLDLSPEQEGELWRVTHAPSTSQLADPDKKKIEQFDAVIVCNGIFSKPNIPDLAGRVDFEANGGTVLHSSELRDLGQITGKQTIIVGFGKSALDIAYSISGVAASVSLVCRRLNWRIPKKLLGFLPAKYLILSRFGELWFRRPAIGRLGSLGNALLAPVHALYWAGASLAVGLQLNFFLSKLRPHSKLQADTGSSGFGFAPDDDFRAIAYRDMNLHRTQIARLTAEEAVLENGTTLPAQVVVLATGFEIDMSMFREAELARLLRQDGRLRLYRNLVCPGLKNLGFVGYNGSGASQILSFVGAQWLEKAFSGKFKLPDTAAMTADVDTELAWREATFPNATALDCYTSPMMMNYLDRLRNDMGLRPADAHRNYLVRLFTPIQPSDYEASD